MTSKSGQDWLNPPDTVRAVLCYIRKGNSFLLLMKSKGKFGEGFWNAPGGKIEDGETEEEAVRREVLEETGLVVENLSEAGFLEFYFGEGKRIPDWTAKVFSTASFSGNLKEKSEEGTLSWFSEDRLPYDNMWEDDRHWLPLVIKGRRFRGSFLFSADSKKLLDSKVKELD